MDAVLNSLYGKPGTPQREAFRKEAYTYCGLTKTLTLLLLLCALLPVQAQRVIPGDERTDLYYPLLEGKRIALFSNHTGMVGNRHLLDILLEQGFRVTAIFSPEHGFRGRADAGEHVASSVDPDTGVPILSLYDGKEQKPSRTSMQKFDVLLVDIQDVGLRYYTYYITLCRLMDACAEHGKPVIVLDRPNPNGHYVDGPVLDMKHKSGVGWLPIPVVHGMTLGELARMVNGEGWLPQGRKCRLTVIPCQNYTHATPYPVPIAPSPNLPNMTAIYLYPSLCYFEATPVSVGRGTDKPFQQYGHPDLPEEKYPYTFTPRSLPGAKNPPQQGHLCHGKDLSHLDEATLRTMGIDLTYLIEAYHDLKPTGKRFFTSLFEKLIGVDYVRPMIEQGSTADEIRARWQQDVEQFKERRKPYLLYEE